MESDHRPSVVGFPYFHFLHGGASESQQHAGQWISLRAQLGQLGFQLGCRRAVWGRLVHREQFSQAVLMYIFLHNKSLAVFDVCRRVTNTCVHLCSQRLGLQVVILALPQCVGFLTKQLALRALSDTLRSSHTSWLFISLCFLVLFGLMFKLTICWKTSPHKQTPYYLLDNSIPKMT